MTRKLAVLAILVASLAGARGAEPQPLTLKRINNDVAIYRAGKDKPILVYAAPMDGRPFIHPIVAPDGKGVLTELSPAHHKHQTGIFVGLLKVNGRDYFHNRGNDYFFNHTATTDERTKKMGWTFHYGWLDKNRDNIVTEVQEWTFQDFGTFYVLDLSWTAIAAVPVTIEKYDYGGLFVRMPWTAKGGGEAVSSEGKKNAQAEGQRARWIDIGMPIAGRDDWGHIAVLDHKANPGHPAPWRVDTQLGVGPSRSRLGEWKIVKGDAAKAKYRFVIYTGKTDTEKVEEQWKEFTK